MFRTPTENYNRNKPRVSHLKFLGNRPVTESSGKYNRVVSLAWFFYQEQSSINYSFTIWTSTSEDKTWNRKKHRETALERYWKDSYYVTLEWPKDEEGQSKEYDFDNYTMDWFIAMKLIYDRKRSSRYNMPNKEKFLAKYDLSWKSRLDKYNENFNENNLVETDRYNINYTVNDIIFGFSLVALSGLGYILGYMDHC